MEEKMPNAKTVFARTLNFEKAERFPCALHWWGVYKYEQSGLEYMIDELKKKNKNVKVAFHSDSYIEPVIDDLIEVGVDLLNPIQPESMDPAYIKKRYGSRIALWGTVSTQYTLPFKGPEDVEAEVRERIRTCAPGGGFLIAPTHNIQLDVPLENVDAFYRAVKKYGRYPVKV